MTIHKSQGSEFDSVTLVLPDYDVPVLTRELFYTGLTRARVKLGVYGEAGIVEQTIKRRVQRTSGVAARISTSGIE
ncbi:MAG: ATP-binding domain-containing protein [Salinisphaera sp.]|jgi:exodeoxyribonuclease V alpha subunit|nr:ATP-binding domain-containing protein [Salinisphaera sp.]